MPTVRQAAAVLIGSLILSFGINIFLVPFELLDGGMIGIGLIIRYLLGIKAGFAIMILSLPIFALAWFYYRDYFYNSLHGMLISSLLIDALFPLHDWLADYIHLPSLLNSIIGGALIGLGIGIMLRFDTSTGGTDLLAQFLADLFHWNVGLIIFLIDAIVIGIGGLLISKETMLLSTVTILSVGITTSLCTWRKSDHARG